MSRDLILKGDDGVLYSYDCIRGLNFLQGHAPGVRVAVNFLLERSKQLFGAGKDEEAKLLRRLSQELEEEARKAEAKASEYDRENPMVVSEERESRG